MDHKLFKTTIFSHFHLQVAIEWLNDSNDVTQVCILALFCPPTCMLSLCPHV